MLENEIVLHSSIAKEFADKVLIDFASMLPGKLYLSEGFYNNQNVKGFMERHKKDFSDISIRCRETLSYALHNNDVLELMDVIKKEEDDHVMKSYFFMLSKIIDSEDTLVSNFSIVLGVPLVNYFLNGESTKPIIGKKTKFWFIKKSIDDNRIGIDKDLDRLIILEMLKGKREPLLEISAPLESKEDPVDTYMSINPDNIDSILLGVAHILGALNDH